MRAWGSTRSASTRGRRTRLTSTRWNGSILVPKASSGSRRIERGGRVRRDTKAGMPPNRDKDKVSTENAAMDKRKLPKRRPADREVVPFWKKDQSPGKLMKRLA